MRYSELVQMYFERSTALQWYWTLYVIIVGGLLAFSTLRVRQDAVKGVLVTILFCMFAYKNLGAIRETMAQRQAVVEAIHQSRSDADSRLAGAILEPTLVSPPYDGVQTFHIASDVLTVAAIWGMELRRRKDARIGPPK